MRSWQFLTNHALTLVFVVIHPESTVREIARGIGITERATLAILRDLDEEGIVRRHRAGRRTTYSIDFERLSMVRRGGVATPLTPRLFVNLVVKMLFEMYPQPDLGPQAEAPRSVRAEDLEPRAGNWGFFTNHMLILLAIARDRQQTVRELAAATDITERAAVAILKDLEEEGVIDRGRDGRRNTYTLDVEAFRRFRGWAFDVWIIPPRLIDVAAAAISALAAGHTEAPTN